MIQKIVGFDSFNLGLSIEFKMITLLPTFLDIIFVFSYKEEYSGQNCLILLTSIKIALV
jgi:hypothetical protein